jgi:hypothetical protein
MVFFFFCRYSYVILDYYFASRTLALKETTNSTKHLNKNENYIKILEMPFIFNLQTVLTARHHYRSS